jgi:hypothetical protein
LSATLKKIFIFNDFLLYVLCVNFILLPNSNNKFSSLNNKHILSHALCGSQGWSWLVGFLCVFPQPALKILIALSLRVQNYSWLSSAGSYNVLEVTYKILQGSPKLITILAFPTGLLKTSSNQ